MSFYVYVYIDPRNHEEFYYGKGQGSRKDAHLYEISDSEKSKRIQAINLAGLEPVIRVIASDLTEHDALLVEKTLLWKLGKQLTNISSGHYANNFRPHDTLHELLSGFDYQNGLYYYNVGEGPSRNWDDYCEFSFVSAGGGARWRDAMLGFHPGDVIAAYLKSYGYVGVGRIIDSAVPVRDVQIGGLPLLDHKLRADTGFGSECDETCEYVCRVEWLAEVPRTEAKWKPKSGLYSTTHVRASLDRQPETVSFLNQQFGLELESLIV